MALLKWDPHTCGGQYLEDLSTAYWYSDALFTALDLGLFAHLEARGSTPLDALAKALDCDAPALDRYLHLLETLSLVEHYEDSWYNTLLTSTYLIPGKPLYQGNSILWRREIKADWETLKEALKAGGRVHFLPDDTSESEMDKRRREYITAMDNVVKLKVPEILTFFGGGLKPHGKILDVGTGSGAFALGFLEASKSSTATLLDIRQVLPHTKAILKENAPSFGDRITFQDQNILEPQWQLSETYDIIILSNIVHAYAESEIESIFNTACKYLSADGIILIHDFFLDHWDIKAAFSDINMFINTYNGKVFDSRWVDEALHAQSLKTTGLIPLGTDTGVVFAAKEKSVLDALTITPLQQILQPIKNLGFQAVLPFDPKDTVVAPFAQNKCKFGCDFSDKKTCSRNGELTAKKTRELLDSYTTALLLKGEPPTGDFQRQCLLAEAKAFKAGYHKAFVFWAGPCSICPDCDPTAPCQNHKHSRPSMEGSGIDVFETVATLGEKVKTLSEKGEVIKYYALLLLK